MYSKPRESMSFNKWILFTSAGWLIGVLFVLLLATLFETTNISGQAAVGIGMSAGIGIMQWFAIKKHHGINKNWIWLLILGISIPFILFDLLSLFMELKPENFIAPVTALGGLFAGWLQYRFILMSISENAKTWIVYNCIGWLLASLATMSLFWLIAHLHLDRRIVIPLAFVIVLIGGPLLGLITGRSIVSILKK